MTEPLFNPPPATVLRPLTDRQTRILGLIASAPDGLDPSELGARLHAGQLRHMPDERCETCGRDGARALKERAIRQRLVKRPGGFYVVRGLDPDEPSGDRRRVQLDDLPGTSFEDIFGDAA